MDHLGPWLFVAVILIGSVARASRGVRRFAAGVRQASAQAASEAAARARTAQPAPVQAAELARGRSMPGPAPANLRTTAPTRRVPLAAARPGEMPSDLGETPPSPGGRALAGALRNPAGLRNAVVLAEVLAPPVGLR